MRRLIFATLLVLCGSFTAHAQTLQGILQTHVDEVAKPSRRGVAIVLDDLVASGLPQATPFLEQWAERNVWQRDDGLFFIVTDEGETLTLKDVDTGAALSGAKEAFSQVRPNGGVRRAIGTALVQFQLSDPEISRRQAAVDSIARRGTAEQLAPLRASIAGETDPDLRARKEQLVNFLAARFSDDPAERIAAIKGLSGDISVETRAVLNQILTTKDGVATQEPAGSIAALRDPMQDPEAAYAELVAAKLAPPRQTASEIRAVLEANIDAGRVGGVPLAQLNTIPAREQAYAALAAADLAPELITEAYRNSAIDAHVFYTLYDEDDATVTAAAEAALAEVEARVGRATFVDLTLDALSLASIFFLAAIGLAITFGVMKVINMAHGEFIMMGAYTGFVVQQFIPNYTVSILVALPLAFAVTFGAGVLMERLVIRHLYHRPLETLLATFGISIALQQLAKNIFGTQARPLTSPDWLAGAWVLNDVVQISYIRIAIFVLAFIFLGLILFILKRTRLGLEVRAVTQNPGMASSMGINPDRINMMTFGLGSGIAGIAGVAIGLYAKVTSEMGADYIVQSFMTVVVGGVGNVWGTLAGATLIGFGQKGIEWLNPSNTLAAQTYMILLVILFIQFRPRGIVALKGRAAGDD